MTGRPRFGGDDRGVSITVTHVLTVGITTILISGLLIGAGSMLEGERQQSAEASLETIGERLANEVSNVDRLANESETMTVETSHQREVSGSTYTVELRANCSAQPLIDDSSCLVLESTGEDVEVAVPIDVDEDDIADGSSSSGGSIVIVWDGGEIALEDGDTR